MEWEKELESLRRSRRSTRPRDLHRLLSAAGFERRYGKGDHWIYRHPRTGRQFTVDPRNPLLPVYVGLAIQAIEEVLNDEDG